MNESKEMPVIILNSVNSTNLYGKNNIEILNDRDVIVATEQTQGRGRLMRTWNFVGADNIYMSFILKPSDKFCDVYSNITQYLSVVVANLIETYGIDSQIKWPNDVLINGKKVCGILSETVMQGSTFKGLVLGVGINLNCSNENMNIIDRPATSLNLEIGKDVYKQDFIDNLVKNFFKDYDEFLTKGFEFIKNDYIDHASFLHKDICVNMLNSKIFGYAKDLTKNGALILENKETLENQVITIGDIL